MKEIQLTNGGIAKVSDSKYEKVMTKKWCKDSNGYICSSEYLGRVNGKTVNSHTLLHRFVMDAKPGQMIDHKNGVKEDCQDENLRFATMSENLMNSKVRVDNLSGVKGIGFNKALQKYHARFKVMGKEYHVGYFKTLAEATISLDEARRKVLSDDAILR